MEQRIRGRKWMKTRTRIFMRDYGMCQSCLKEDRITPATQIDHIVALTNGGTNADSNLEAICDNCHRVKTASDTGKQARKTVGLDGWPE